MSDDIRDYHDTDAVVGEVACILAETEAEARGDWVEDEFLPVLDGVEELEEGFTFSFPDTDDALETVVTAVLLESRCCSDESYTLDVPADDDQIYLTVTGPEGTKGLVQEGFFDMFEDVPEPV